MLKEDDSNLEALLFRGRAYYYLADHDVAMRSVCFSFFVRRKRFKIFKYEDRFNCILNPGITRKGYALTQNTVN